MCDVHFAPNEVSFVYVMQMFTDTIGFGVCALFSLDYNRLDVLDL